jgi:alpha-1,2-mannosyltransferase
MAANPNVQTLRFRRPTNNEETKTAEEKKPKLRHTGILQDQIRRYEDRASAHHHLTPPVDTNARHGTLDIPLRSASCYSCASVQRCIRTSPTVMKVHGLLLWRRRPLTSSIVYNFWEPLHYLDQGNGFQTWETSPVYAIRSYAYILLHWAPTPIAQFLARDKVRPLCCLPVPPAEGHG